MTEDELRAAQQQYLADEAALAKARAWTPNLVEVTRLVVEVLNDKHADATKRDVAAAVDEVISVMQLVHRRITQPGVWSVAPVAALPPVSGFVPRSSD